MKWWKIQKLCYTLRIGTTCGRDYSTGFSQRKVVLCDRFLDSSIAFQGFGLNRDLGLIKLVNEKVIGGVMPTLTFCLDLEPKLALARTGGDRIEQRGMDYYHRVRQGYHQIAESEPNRFFIVDATGSPEEIFQRVWEIISGRDLL